MARISSCPRLNWRKEEVKGQDIEEVLRYLSWVPLSPSGSPRPSGAKQKTPFRKASGRPTNYVNQTTPNYMCKIICKLRDIGGIAHPQCSFIQKGTHTSQPSDASVFPECTQYIIQIQLNLQKNGSCISVCCLCEVFLMYALLLLLVSPSWGLAAAISTNEQGNVLNLGDSNSLLISIPCTFSR